MIIKYFGLNEFVVYGLGLLAWLILFFANKKMILSYLNTLLSSKKTGIKTRDYFSFSPFTPSPKKWEISYKDGIIDGMRIQWHKNGQKQQECNFKDGKQDGMLTQWHENGQKQLERNYKKK